MSASLDTNGNSINFTGDISGTGTLPKSGADVLALTGAATSTGLHPGLGYDTLVDAGTLQTSSPARRAPRRGDIR